MRTGTQDTLYVVIKKNREQLRCRGKQPTDLPLLSPSFKLKNAFRVFRHPGTVKRFLGQAKQEQ